MKHFPSFSGKCFSLLIVLILQVSFASSQTFEITNSLISVHGIAREKPWSMTAQAAEGFISLISRDHKLIGAQSLNFSINVSDLKSESTKMDQRAYKALKAYPYNRIQYFAKAMKLREVGTSTYLLVTEGNLHIAGITQISSIIINIIVNGDGTLSCSGSKEIKLGDFNVGLLPAEQRVMKVKDKVRVDFSLTLTKTSSKN